MSLFKGIIILALGIVIGAFLHEQLSIESKKQERAGFILKNELKQVERFLTSNKQEQKVNYCSSYNLARYNNHVIKEKIKLYDKRKVSNGLLYDNLKKAKTIIKEFEGLKKETLKYNCLD